MYRYSVDNAVTYTSEDIVLFRESPFACWMERLTLENPDHGIPPDRYSKPPANSMERQDELAATLRAEDKHVSLVDWDAPEPARRRETLEAMRRGVDYIVNGQLALGPLSGSANLLMRTSGFSELGNYLYIPCDTQAKTTLNSNFRLCFLADLLHSLQGQLPPQMLIIRGGADLLPLATEDHIYHYRAVKHRFMQAMRDFRKHRMPDPAESAQFGRWSECANEVLKQRALRGEDAAEEAVELEAEEQRLPLQAMAAAPVPEPPPVQDHTPTNGQDRRFGSRGIPVGDTLASRARQMAPLAFRGDHSALQPPSGGSSLLESALQNLEFIGSSSRSPSIGESRPTPASRKPAPPSAEAPAPVAETAPEAEETPTPAPAPTLSTAEEENVPAAEVTSPAAAPTALEPVAAGVPAELSPRPERKPHPLDCSGFFDVEPLDALVPPPLDSLEPPPPIDGVESPPPVLPTDSQEFEIDCVDDSDYQMPPDPAASPLDARLSPAWDVELQARQPEPSRREAADEPAVIPSRPFSSSLNTADFEDI
ncbi:hypothetical protein DWB85_04510 [Seongchinamella sediminis]|uniref:Uncharacterized protein n=1 Tax=Seongchinamella sediminis TaxID=2283635 RepID=A0A3L7E4A1_9GAMM|nr:hypothetical protein [Seongchinamella sediminis]RLQ23232.1 hypothetical protein DWB85_04510 [Seongchinamella sediminis]